ncbi:39S ribosomal protein L33, mitochondrial [Aspergillus hancockii]|nr:39S ribosomal protein L33, mitochondrial [Aspergillus hancockii]
MSYFRVTLVRSAIGLPRRTTDVLKALGLKKRMATVFHPVSPSVAEVHLERKPDPGYYIEQTSGAEWKENRSQ